jgi:hypothetical protein
VAVSGIAAQSATEPRANAAVMMNIRIGRHPRTSRMKGVIRPQQPKHLAASLRPRRYVTAPYPSASS